MTITLTPRLEKLVQKKIARGEYDSADALVGEAVQRLIEEEKEEDRRRVCRERKTLTAERIQHVNRIKGLLFSQGISGYDPLRSNRRRQLDELKTGDGRPLPPHFKAQIARELDRLELVIGQIKAVETERDALVASVSEPVNPSADLTPTLPARNNTGLVTSRR